MHPDPNVDLCAIIAAPIHNHFNSAGKGLGLIHLDRSISATVDTYSDLIPMEEVSMIGFPNGIWDSVNNGAIARRGIIATIPEKDYLGKREFVVDMACFPSSSGSPVFWRTWVPSRVKVV